MTRHFSLLIGFIFFLLPVNSHSQYRVSFIISDSATGEKLQGVSVKLNNTAGGGQSDSAGNYSMTNVKGGKQLFTFTIVGYTPFSLQLNFPLNDPRVIIQLNKGPGEELAEVIISSSRTDSRIENTPTRVEVLGAEEVEEEGGVKPAHIASLLGDVAGIQAQQTSAITGNTNLRIQGLPGDYTQILRNGMPLFGGYAGSFSILQVPPLDLKQIEIIKGASSTLYGGGAIAGLINIIPKKPLLGKRERYLLLNQSTLGESNLNLYLSDRDKKIGYTFFSGGTYQKEADVNGDGFSDVAANENIFFHPVFYFYPDEKNTVSVGLHSIFEDRKGGDMQVLRNRPSALHQFYIENQSLRNTLELIWDKKVKGGDKFSLKANFSNYKRDITTNVFGMKAKQLSFYTEAGYVWKRKRHDLVGGLNFNGDRFRKIIPDSSSISDYRFFTAGLFIQDDWRIHPKIIIESGLRADFHNQYGTFVLPRISVLFKISPYLASRVGGGMGYRVPTVFNGEVDERSYRNLRLDVNAKAERSLGANWDINFKKEVGDAEVSINQSFFYTRINHPLVASNPPGLVYYTAAKPVITMGIETWVQLAWKKAEAYLGYTFTDARKKYDALQPYVELSARNKFASVISYEFTKNFRALLEAAYTGRQYLANGKTSPSFPFVAAMVRYDIPHFSFVLNCENLLDYRQGRKVPIINPPYTNPTFDQLWSPIEGRAVNLSVKISW